MIIKELHIDGFGIFNGFSMTTLDKGVNIIIGNNEAGKSTLLKFLRYTLFGYPRLKDQRMPPLNGGNHGGRIKAVLSSGKVVFFERSGDDHINLLYNEQENQNESQWSQLLGNASPSLYNNVYAFSLEELVGLDSLSQSGVEDKIFSVGLGLGKISIGEIENNILNRIDAIYKHRGSVQLIPRILKELDKKRSRIKQIQNNMPEYQNIIQNIKQLEKSVKGLDDQIEKLRAEKSKLDNYIKCYDSFITITMADEALERLPGYKDFPAKGVEQLDKLEELEEDCKGRIRELLDGNKDEKGINELENKIKAISFNSYLLEKSERIEFLRKNIEKYKQAVEEKLEEEQKILDYDQSINQYVENINKHWTEKNIIGFTNVTVHNDKIEAFKSNFDNIAEEKRNLEAELKVRLIQSKESILNIYRFLNFISLILIITSIPAFFYSWYVPAGALLLISLLLFLGKKYFVKKDHFSHLQKKIDLLKFEEQKIKDEYEDYLEKQLNLATSLSPDTVSDVFKRIEQIKKDITGRDKIIDKLNKQRLPFIKGFEKEAMSLTDGLESSEKEEDIKGSIGRLSGGLQYKDQENPESKGQYENIEIIVNRIITEFDDTKINYDNKEKFKAELSRKKAELKRIGSKLANVRTAIEDLLASVDAKDRDDFRKIYEENNKVNSYIKAKESAVATIEKIVGHNKSHEVITYLKEYEKEAIELSINKLDSDIKYMKDESTTKKDERGRKSNEIERIEGESELAEGLTELESIKQKLQNAYKDWLIGKIALKLLSDVKKKYEKEKQPEVIKKSSNYFNLITKESYKKIRVSLDRNDVAVYDAQEVSKTIEQLSRGTKEQLLISLRLGFIEEYEKKSEPLPVIIDEVLVNFDPYRGRKTAEILHRFGENRQILFFTCHPSTMNYFDSSSVCLIHI